VQSGKHTIPFDFEVLHHRSHHEKDEKGEDYSFDDLAEYVRPLPTPVGIIVVGERVAALPVRAEKRVLVGGGTPIFIVFYT
jgi:hypothetical protein